jgi:tripartite-type tricarboxylate transporter receptor subunit TctC
MNCTRRTAIAAVSCTLAWPPSFAMGKWPEKPIRLIVPLAAGSAVDNAARIVMQKVGERVGQGRA